MPVSHTDVNDLILTIHSAALEPNGWNRVGQELLSALSAQSGIGLRVPSHARPEPWAVLIDFDPSAAAAYAEHWGREDLWYHGARRTGRISTGLVSIDSQLASTGELESSPFFNDYLRHLDIGRMIQVCLAGSEPHCSFGQAALSLYRGIGQPAFSADDMQLLSLLAPHLTVAAKNYWAAQSLRLLTSARANALDALSSAVYAIDQSQRLMFSNRLGEEMIHEARWVRVLGSTLTPSPTVVHADRFAAELRRASLGIGSTILVTDAMTGTEAQVSITPIPPSVDFGFLGAAPVALVWITPATLRKDTGQDMALLFGLTPAERRILDKLIAGADLRETATSLHVSIHTARAQLKSILRKTGRRSQGQLLMLAARIATLST